MYLIYFFQSACGELIDLPGDPATSDLPGVNTASHAPDHATSLAALTPPTTPIRSSPPRTITPEERAAQLRKQLALLNSERDDLISELKLARRESQRAETALKGEIEILKRASEKHASGEHRSRQKVLALQEAVKQASAAAGGIEKMAVDIEEAMLGLSERAEEVQVEHNKVTEQAERRSTAVDAAMQADRKLVAELQGDLAGVCAKLEKVTGKKEKLEREAVPQLEERLQEIQREMEEMERANPTDDNSQQDEEDIHGPLNVRNWVPPIQRPSPHQRHIFTSNASFHATAPSFSPPRQATFRSPRAPHFKPCSNAVLPPLLPSYDPNFSLRGLPSHEEAPGPKGEQSIRMMSELKPGSTFHTPPRFQTPNTSYPAPFDFVVRRPSPNFVSSGEDDPPSRQTSLPTPGFMEAQVESASDTRRNN